MTRDTDEEPTVTARPADADGDVTAVERDLAAAGEPYARVTVVRREPPVSANVGDRGVVTREGDLHGWIGGAACAQTIATTQAREAIDDGRPRLIGIAPEPDTVDRPGLEAFPMTCHSEGVLELFIEPVNPRPELVIVGGSPVAHALARLAGELAVDVVVVDPTGEAAALPDGVELLTETDPATVASALGHDPLVVVATMGSFDASGVAAGVLADATYVGLIASATRAEEVVDTAAALAERDPDAVAAAVTNPAGVDVEAYTPAEIAVSVLAEVVDQRRGRGDAPRVAGGERADEAADPSASGDSTDDAGGTAVDAAAPEDAAAEGPDEAPEEAIDPVCGMTVNPTETAHSVEHDGETYHFCCGGCAESFAAEPSSYLDAEGAATR
ncbi:XdhC family protein [Halobaculum gomorrense]|uniref:Xanthine dehydrogenase accessory factor n=1 Tax=Halobaculum gomorrense TaxID=43928 RepID=A0A1M5T3S5_9EURY|nr:XdhC family protein [Halobaculum gomorrense]SHH45023.1 xanthine dehydrogenase accessory factor [Halobaculum gomorrense]